MNVKAWLDIYDDTQYRDGNWNVDIVAKTFRTLLADIDELYDDREELIDALESCFNMVHYLWHKFSELNPGHMAYTLHGDRKEFDAEIILSAISSVRKDRP